jgi:uncharacterized membrane protein
MPMPFPNLSDRTLRRAPGVSGAVWRWMLPALLLGFIGTLLTIALYRYSGQSVPHYLLYHSLIELVSVGTASTASC